MEEDLNIPKTEVQVNNSADYDDIDEEFIIEQSEEMNEKIIFDKPYDVQDIFWLYLIKSV